MAKTSTSWTKGKTGNPNGAPKRSWTWASELQKAVEEATKDGRPIKEIIAKALVRETLKGNVHAMRELMNRMDGMPMQGVDVTSLGEKLEAPHITIDTKP